MIHDYEKKLAAQQAEALRVWGGGGVLGPAASNVAGGSALASVREPELRALIDRVHSSISEPRRRSRRWTTVWLR